jgi:hypothetical protein
MHQAVSECLYGARPGAEVVVATAADIVASGFAGQLVARGGRCHSTLALPGIDGHCLGDLDSSLAATA